MAKKKQEAVPPAGSIGWSVKAAVGPVPALEGAPTLDVDLCFLWYPSQWDTVGPLDWFQFT